MSRLRAALLALAVLVVGAQPSAGQASADTRAQSRILDTLVALWRKAAHEVRTYDDTVHMRLVMDTVRAGNVRVLVDHAVLERGRRAAEIAGKEIERIAGPVAARLAPNSFIEMRRKNLITNTDSLVVSARVNHTNYQEAFGTPSDSALAAWMVTDALWLISQEVHHSDPAFNAWLPSTVVPDSESTISWTHHRLSLVSADEAIGRRCYAGDLDACHHVLGLKASADPVRDYFDAADRRRVVERDARYIHVRDRAEADRCVEGADEACANVLRNKDGGYKSRLGREHRESVMRLAMLLGGPAGYQRLMGTAGTPAQRLAAAAGVPIESVVTEWQRRMVATRVPSQDMSPGIAASSFLWILVCGALGAEEFPVALTLERWIALAIGGALVAMTLLLSEPGGGRVARTNPRLALVMKQEAMARASSAAAYRLRRMQLRDSIRAALKSAQGVRQASIGASFSTADRVRLNAFLQRIELQSGKAGPGASDRVFIVDTLTNLRGRLVGHGSYEIGHVLPTPGYERCMSVAMFGGVVVGGRIIRYEWFNTNESAARFLGPCAFYERYGNPGPEIDRWLRDGGWMFGTAGLRRVSLFASNGRPSWYVEPSSYWWGNAGWEFREYISTEGFRCIAGDAAMCTASLLDPASDIRGRRMRALSGGMIETRTYWWQRNALGPWQGSLLADMAGLIGDENFRKFWTSTQSPTEAFASATGQSLGAWTASWTKQSYGEIGHGPELPLRSVAWAVVVLLVAFGGATASFRLRQVA